ncbi:hypothetical protein GCM10009625_37590 [Brachybacterium fresconis]
MAPDGGEHAVVPGSRRGPTGEGWWAVGGGHGRSLRRRRCPGDGHVSKLGIYAGESEIRRDESGGLLRKVQTADAGGGHAGAETETETETGTEARPGPGPARSTCRGPVHYARLRAVLPIVEAQRATAG